MAKTVAGRLVVSFEANTTGLTTGATQAGQALNRVKKSTAQVGQAQEQQTRSSRKSLQAFLELGRGAEDFGAVFGTTGFAGGIRASANNLSQFASILHPAAGAIVGLSVGIGSLLIPQLFKTADTAKETKKQVEELTKAVSDFYALNRESLSFGVGLRGIDESDVPAAEKGLKSRIKEQEFEAEGVRRLRKGTETNLRAEIRQQFGLQELAELGAKILGEEVGFGSGTFNQADVGGKFIQNTEIPVQAILNKFDAGSEFRKKLDAVAEPFKDNLRDIDKELVRFQIRIGQLNEKLTDLAVEAPVPKVNPFEDGPIEAPVPPQLSAKERTELEIKGLQRGLRNIGVTRRILGGEKRLLADQLEATKPGGPVSGDLKGSSQAFTAIQDAIRQASGDPDIQQKLKEIAEKELELHKQELAILKKLQPLQIQGF